MSDFINDVINADAILEQIDDYVEKWHELDTSSSIYEYLGMTEEEYFLWVENDFYLKYIVTAHEQNRSISEVLEKVYTDKLVARSSTPEEAKQIYDWLVEKGLVNNEH